MGPPRTYSSAATPDDAVSTEGIDFTLDEVEFICHGRISAFDLSEFAGPAADAGENIVDPDVVRLLADLMRMVLGDQTYREVTKHRRKHQTPDSVMQQILMDVVGAVGGRPSARPSPSRAGRRPAVRPAAVSPSPASPAPATAPEPAPERVLSAQMLATLARDGDIRFAPGDAATTANPASGKRAATVRRLSLAHPERGVQVEERTG
jgi:hypothetical protein